MQNLKRLSNLVKFSGKRWTYLAQATSYSILNRLFDITPPLLIGAAVDIVVSKEQSIMGQWGLGSSMQQLYILVFVTVLVWAGESLFEYLYKHYWWNLSQSLQHNLRIHAYSHVQSLEMSYFEDQSTGNLLSILNDDVNQLERFFNIGANELIQFSTTMITIGGLYLITVPQITWWVLIPMPFVFLGSVYFQKLLAERYAVMRASVGTLSSIIANNMSGIATIKSYVTEDYELKRLERASNDYREKNELVIAINSAFVPVIRMIIVVGFSGILLGAGKLTLDGSLNVGLYSTLVFMSQRLLWPLTRLGDTLDQFQRSMASANRVYQLLAEKPAPACGKDVTSADSVRGGLQFRNVSFSYEGRNRILQDVSLTIEPGETVAFVGATGSGKSTLLKLLLKFYHPVSGEIKLDSQNLEQLSTKSLRQAIGYVSQDTYLFHGTVAENIGYGSFDKSPEDIRKAAERAECMEFIERLPDGFDTIIGERGQKLSGGQRQRLSIARALLKDPPILILDEATSAVDNETEAAIQRSLEHIIEGRTTIMVAHRLSTIVKAQKIFVLSEGSIVEVGTHQELLKLDGHYAQLWKVQTGSNFDSLAA